MVNVSSTQELVDTFSSESESIFSYFCKYDALTDVVACPGVIFPALKDSCYVSREAVFGPAPQE